jgi:hypothetical protein
MASTARIGQAALRERLAESVVAADIGVCADAMVSQRQTDLFNRVAVALTASPERVALVIGLAEGDQRDTTGKALDFMCTFTATLYVHASDPDPLAKPEDEIFEDLLRHFHGLKLDPADPLGFMFLVDGWGELRDSGVKNAIARQIVLKRRAVVPPAS